MVRALYTLTALGYVLLAVSTPFVLPWPVAATLSMALLMIAWAQLECRDTGSGR